MPSINYLTLQIDHSTASEYGKPIHNLDQFSDQTVQIAAVAGLIFMSAVLYTWWKQRGKKRRE